MEKTLERRIEAGEYLGYQNHEIAGILGIPENDIAAYQYDRDVFFENEEKWYREYELPRVHAGIKEWIQEIPEAERREMKRQGLLNQLQELKKTPSDPRLPKLVKDIKIFTGRFEGISPENIARASAYPLEKLIKSRNGMALCPFHPDKTPSMDIRKNFFYCYGCGETGNAIDLIRVLENLTFRQAVERLS